MLRSEKHFNKQIVLAQTAAILIWLMISVIQWSNNPQTNPGIFLVVIVRGIESFSLLLISLLLIFAIDKLTIKMKQFALLILMIPLIYVGSVLANAFSLSIRHFIGFAAPPIDSYFYIQSLHFFIPLTLVLVFVEIIRYKNQAQIDNENKLIAEKSLHESQWIMLRYQLNPHFLFNALNTIRALIGQNDEIARKTITEMSEYFRYSLSIKDHYHVTISEEMNAVNNYLEIQKIRFQEKIGVELNLENNVLNCLIPVFTIQTLVENAVKYGLKTSEEVLKIVITCSLHDDRLNISVRNSGTIVNSEGTNENGTSIGIDNLKKRLNLFYPDSGFDLVEKDGFVTAHISIRNCKKNGIID